MSVSFPQKFQIEKSLYTDSCISFNTLGSLGVDSSLDCSKVLHRCEQVASIFSFLSTVPSTGPGTKGDLGNSESLFLLMSMYLISFGAEF